MSAENYICEIDVLSQSNNSNRRKMNLASAANSYKDLNGDNELILKPISRGDQKFIFNECTTFKQRY